MKTCACGCGREVRGEGPYNTAHRNVCRCGCGERCRYGYVPGHRKKVECSRCGLEFTPVFNQDQPDRCAHCRVKVARGGPEVLTEQSAKIRKQKAAPPGKRYCHGCDRYRAVKFFPKNSKGRCKPCARAQSHASRLALTYNITPERYEEIKASQGGRCAICQVATGATRNLAVDHDHACCPGRTSCGKCVRGLLCSRCNKMLGFARDNPAFFARAIDYLQDPPAQNQE